MARDFDNFPTYDPVVRDEVYLSSIWADFIATFVESLQEYLSANGMFVPRLTEAQRDAIQNPVEGQLVYVDDPVAPTVPHTAHLEIWQVVAGVGQWTVIV
jgi:hypothetical protein